MSDPAIVGIDTNSFGFHAVSNIPIRMMGDDPLSTNTYGWVVNRDKDAQQRRSTTFIFAHEFFTALPRASAVFIEEPIIMMKNPETTRKLVMIAGVIEAAFFYAKPDASLFWVPLGVWRKRVLGVGGGKSSIMKDLAKEWVHKQWWDLPTDAWLPVEADYDNKLDLYDAHCIMAYGMWALTTETVRLK